MQAHVWLHTEIQPSMFLAVSSSGLNKATLQPECVFINHLLLILCSCTQSCGLTWAPAHLVKSSQANQLLLSLQQKRPFWGRSRRLCRAAWQDDDHQGASWHEHQSAASLKHNNDNLNHHSLLHPSLAVWLPHTAFQRFTLNLEL